MATSIQHVAPESLRPHPLNPRATRPKEDVAKLAERMKRNGFEATRAPWVVDGLVFAGATRVAAAVEAGLASIPVVVHGALTDEDVVRLADQENENDEYHVKVPLLDTWASYAALSDAGWTQERIAKAKGCKQQNVSLRLKLFAELPKSAKRAVSDGLLEEGHCEAILTVVSDVGYSAWLTTAQARDELVRDITISAPDTRHRGKLGPTVEQVRSGAARWKELITKVVAAHNALPEAYRAAFIDELSRTKARQPHAVEAALVPLLAKVATDQQKAVEAARKATSEADAQASAAKAASEATAARVTLAARIHHGDARDLVRDVPAGYQLLLTDPPYGIGLGGGRSTKSKRPSIANDATAGDAVALLDAVLPALFERMADDGTALMFTSWQYEPEFRAALTRAGFRVVGSLVWVKNNHGTAGGEVFTPQHERVLHAVKGKPLLQVRRSDVFEAPANQKTEHPTEKPEQLLQQLIESTTARGETVVDPFCGSGTALSTAHRMGREFWGCEIDERWVSVARERVVTMARLKAA